MNPPGLMADARPGVTTLPSKNDLIKAARIILDNCGIPFSQHKIVRLVLKFQDRAPNAAGHLFFLYLANAVRMSDDQKRAAQSNPDIARVISYADSTGETAVNQVLQQRGW